MIAPTRRTALLLALALLTPLAARPAAPADEIHLVVLHTNDVHGQALPRDATWIENRDVTVGGLVRVAEYVAGVRTEHVGEHRGVLVLDGGDWFQGTPEGAVDAGLPFVEALVAVGYDAMALGNHEFDLGLAPLLRILAEAQPPAVCANLRTPDGSARVDWIEPWRIVEVCGLRIGLVGLVEQGTPFITHPEARALVFEEEVAALRSAANELTDDVDLLIPLTHCGIDVDRRIAEALPELPLIVGGHSHTFLRDGMRVGDTVVAQAGSKATVVGRVDLWIDPATKRVVRSTARLIELEEHPTGQLANPAVAERVEVLAAAAEEALGAVVGELVGPIEPGGPLRSTGIGNWIADVFRAGTRADIGLHNRGGIRRQMVPGPVTRRDLFELLPFPNTVVVLELTGAELVATFERKLLGGARTSLTLSGVAVGYAFDVRGDIGRIELTVGGEAVEPERVYTVATNSYLADGGDRLFEFEREIPRLDTGILLRELLERDLVERGRVAPASDNRYREIRD